MFAPLWAPSKLFSSWESHLGIDRGARFTEAARRLRGQCGEETQCFYESCFQISFCPLSMIRLFSLILMSHCWSSPSF